MVWTVLLNSVMYTTRFKVQVHCQQDSSGASPLLGMRHCIIYGGRQTRLATLECNVITGCSRAGRPVVVLVPVHSWYHFLSLYLAISWYVLDENCSASIRIRSVASSVARSFSPRSIAAYK